MDDPAALALALFPSAPEDGEEELEDVEDVQEDRRCQKRRACDVLRGPQPLEVDHREAGEDHQPGDREDEGPARDPDEDRHDPEHDQNDQSPEAQARERREVASGRVAPVIPIRRPICELKDNS